MDRYVYSYDDRTGFDLARKPPSSPSPEKKWESDRICKLHRKANLKT